ncbi:hypothetical protein GSD1FS_0154 [Bifidobacterium sp. GSD1FS]|uniref:Uncharacterized protein n=1 Tax=Bifidobacterium canis TaxID=2610880 RepID=A0A7K1J2S9_9BIFI|nr:hypothetical protein [Bifidobacterium canis]
MTVFLLLVCWWSSENILVITIQEASMILKVMMIRLRNGYVRL